MLFKCVLIIDLRFFISCLPENNVNLVEICLSAFLSCMFISQVLLKFVNEILQHLLRLATIDSSDSWFAHLRFLIFHNQFVIVVLTVPELSGCAPLPWTRLSSSTVNLHQGLQWSFFLQCRCCAACMS